MCLWVKKLRANKFGIHKSKQNNYGRQASVAEQEIIKAEQVAHLHELKNNKHFCIFLKQ